MIIADEHGKVLIEDQAHDTEIKVIGRTVVCGGDVFVGMKLRITKTQRADKVIIMDPRGKREDITV